MHACSEEPLGGGGVGREATQTHTTRTHTPRQSQPLSPCYLFQERAMLAEKSHTHTQHTTHNTQHTTHTHRGEINRSHRVSLSRSGRWWPRSSCLRTRSCPRLSRPVGTPSWLRQRYACGYMCMHTLCIYHRARTIAHMTSFGGQGTCMCHSNTRSSTESTDAPTLPWFSPAAATHSFTTAYSLAYHTAILLRPPLPLAGDIIPMESDLQQKSRRRRLLRSRRFWSTSPKPSGSNCMAWTSA